MQLMWYLETGEDIQYISQNLPNIIKKIYANELNYLNRYVYVYWDKIWVITDDKDYVLYSILKKVHRVDLIY